MKKSNCETCKMYPNCKDCVNESKYVDHWSSEGAITWGVVMAGVVIIISIIVFLLKN